MKKVFWITDPHLEFLAEEQREDFGRLVAVQEPDVVLLGGDIGNANSVVRFLQDLERIIQRSICFVLGNHDYYHGSIEQVRGAVEEACRQSSHLCWLPRAGVVEITGTTALVGHGAWADGRLGDWTGSTVKMNDYVMIEDLTYLSSDARLKVIQNLADLAAQHIHDALTEALKTYRHLFVLTHVPPFLEACWYQGRASDDNWAPHFANRAVGEVLVRLMEPRPEQRLTVLCGHTHSPGRCEPLPNIEVITGGATYGQPEIQEVFEVE